MLDAPDARASVTLGAMRIGLLSDTHIPEAPVLWPEVFEAFRGVDLILHAGDIMVARALDELERVAPVLAAQGNHDPHLADDPRVQPLHMLNLEGQLVALLHTFEPLDRGIEVLARFYLGGVVPDVVVYGDSHVEHVDTLDGTLVVNPGSPTLPRNQSPRLGYVGFLTLEPDAPPRAELQHLSALGVPHVSSLLAR